LDEDIEMCDRENVEAGGAPNNSPKKYVFIGCSHASRLSLALEDLGVDAKLISTNGWSSDDDIIDNVSEMLKEETAGSCSDTCIIYIHDI
jgi:hypothetical protein